MRKIFVLFLLTIFVGSFTFAIEGIGDFTAALDITVADLANRSARRAGDKSPLGVDIDPSITYSRAFGDFGLEAGLRNLIGLVLSNPAPQDEALNDTLYLWVKPSYSLAAGSGTLGFDLTIKPVFFLAEVNTPGVTTDPAFIINPHVDYGLDAGFGTLGFDLGTESINPENEGLWIYKGGGNTANDYGLGYVGLYFKAGVELPIGFNAYLKPQFAIASQADSKSEFHAVVIGLGYQIIEVVRADIDVTIPIGIEDHYNTFKYSGLTIAPKLTATSGAFETYLGAEIGLIGADLNYVTGKNSVSFKFILGASSSF
jgi:hypothetical protein